MKLSSDNAAEIAARINQLLRSRTYTSIGVVWPFENISIRTGQRMDRPAVVQEGDGWCAVCWGDSYGVWQVSSSGESRVYVEAGRVTVHFTAPSGNRCSWYFVLEDFAGTSAEERRRQNRRGD